MIYDTLIHVIERRYDESPTILFLLCYFVRAFNYLFFRLHLIYEYVGLLFRSRHGGCDYVNILNNLLRSNY